MAVNIFGAPDPFSIPNPFAMAQPQPVAQDGSVPPPPLTPEEQQSLLSRVGNAALGGLGFVGGTLSKAFGGRAIRGALGMLGGMNTPASELLSALPFSDTLGITDPANEVRGSDLLGGDKNTSFFSPEGIGGLGLEVALDPATYLTFGSSALSNLGLKASAAGAKGLIPATGALRAAGLAGTEAANLAAKLGVPVSEVAGKSLGGHIGLKIPFTNIGAAADLSGIGQLASKIPGAGTVGDVANAAYRGYQRIIPPLFEGAVQGVSNPEAQQVARSITEATPRTMASAIGETIPILQAAEKGGFGTTEGSALLRQMGENAIPTTAEGAAVLDPVKQILEGNRQALIMQGIPAEQLTKQTIKSGPGAGETLGYLPRKYTPQEPKSVFDFFKSRSIAPEQTPGRELERYMGLPTQRIHDLVNDQTMQGLNHMQTTDVIQQKYLGFTADKFNKMQGMKQLADQEGELAAKLLNGDTSVKPMLDQIIADRPALKEAQAEWVATSQQAKELAALKQSGKLPEFNNHVLKDFQTKNILDKMNKMKAEKIHEGFGKFAVPLEQAGPDAVPLRQALEDAGMTMPAVTAETPASAAIPNQAITPFGPPTREGEQIGGAMQQTLEQLKKFGKVPPNADNLALDALYVPKDYADSITKLMRSNSMDALQDLAKAYDSMTSLTKGFQTVLWPANHARNQLTALWQNLRVGAFDPTATGPMKIVQPWLDAHALTKGGTVDGLAAKVPMFNGMTDAQAADEFRKLVTQWDVTKRGAKLGTEFIEPADRAGEQFAKMLPSGQTTDVVQAMKGYVTGMVPTTKEAANPLGVSGVLGATKDTFGPIKGGRELASALDNVNRNSVFLAMLEQGKTPEEAFMQSLNAHYDFGNLSRFEKTYMRRLIPYYSWMRQNVPSVLGDILKNPGGFTGQSVKAAYAMEGREPGFVPDYLGSGLKAKLGGQDEAGRQAYLTSTGLPFEDVAQVTSPQDVLSMLNPLIKGPLQAATGRNFFTGRDITGIAPSFGNEGLNNLLSMTPLSRFATAGKMLTDERIGPLEKAFNLVGGGRITTANQAQAERQAVEDYTRGQLLPNPLVQQFNTMYVPRGQMSQLTPQELQLLQLYQRAQQNRLSPR